MKKINWNNRGIKICQKARVNLQTFSKLVKIMKLAVKFSTHPEIDDKRIYGLV